MKLLQQAFLSILLALLILTGASACADIGHCGKGISVSDGSFLDLGPPFQGNPKFADGQQAGDSKAAEPLFPRGLRISPPPREGLPPPPSLPETTPPKALKPDRGVINPRTGEYYPPVPGGVINPKSGEILPKVDGGYINPQTGEFIPAGK